MQKKVTIYDVATRAGVSSSTVSRVLNNSPRVAERTRSCVRSAMRELGYVPDRTARMLARGKNRKQHAEGEENEVFSRPAQMNGQKTRVCFEGDWEAEEREAIQQALSHSQAEAVCWLCVKTCVQGTKTCIALKLHGAHEVIVADSAFDLATQILHRGETVKGEL